MQEAFSERWVNREGGRGHRRRDTACAWVRAVITLLRYAAVGKRGVRVATTNIKEEARKLIEGMPDDSTWEDLVREICVRQAIESGLADSQAGRTTTVETVRAEFGLEK